MGGLIYIYNGIYNPHYLVAIPYHAKEPAARRLRHLGDLSDGNDGVASIEVFNLLAQHRCSPHTSSAVCWVVPKVAQIERKTALSHTQPMLPPLKGAVFFSSPV